MTIAKGRAPPSHRFAWKGFQLTLRRSHLRVLQLILQRLYGAQSWIDFHRTTGFMGLPTEWGTWAHSQTGRSVPGILQHMKCLSGRTLSECPTPAIGCRGGEHCPRGKNSPSVKTLVLTSLNNKLLSQLDILRLFVAVFIWNAFASQAKRTLIHCTWCCRQAPSIHSRCAQGGPRSTWSVHKWRKEMNEWTQDPGPRLHQPQWFSLQISRWQTITLSYWRLWKNFSLVICFKKILFFDHLKYWSPNVLITTSVHTHVNKL